MMRCTDIRDHLDDLVDGRLDPTTAEAVQEHLTKCAACSDDAEALQRLLRRARELPSAMQPDRDLWPEIRVRIAGARPAEGPPAARAGFRPWLRLVAAAVLAAAMAGAWWLGRQQGTRVVVRPTSPTPETVLASHQISGLDTAHAEYERARDELLAVLRSRQSELSPQTVDVVEHNLDVIDTAIAEVRSALRDNPNDPVLGRQLRLAYRRQLDMLQRAVDVPREL